MTHIELSDGKLRLEIRGWDRIWALKGSLEFSLEHVAGVRQDSNLPWGGGLRMGGTALPGVIKAGRYYRNGQWEFWVMHRRSKMIVIDLRDEFYAALYLEMEDPAAAVQQIEQARDGALQKMA